MAQWVKNPPAMQEMLETQIRPLNQEDPLAEGMAPHSSILAWRIPWTEEPGRLQSEGFEESDTTKQLSTRTRTHTHIQQGNYTMISWVYPRNERLS